MVEDSSEAPIPRVGISACLLGQAVRHNGGHKRNDWIVDSLSSWVTLIPICPEMEMGLGTPRDSMRLVVDPAGGRPRLVTVASGRDLTPGALKTVGEILSRKLDLDAYILKKDSPSCGLERVRLYRPNGIPGRDGIGIFAGSLREAFPLLPLIEEGRLSNEEQREHFVTRVFAYARLRRVAPAMAVIQKFHQTYKFILMAHSPRHYHSLGRLVGNAERLTPEALLERYVPLFMEALSVPSNTDKRVNVLQHLMGFLRPNLDRQERSQVLESIEDYRQGQLPFMAPLNLIQHLARKFSVSYLADQRFFMPYPKRLALRNHL